MAPGLYVVATPIGNLRDITLRALDVLRGADLIAAEDTRVTGKLLAAFDIRTPLTPYHDHNAEVARPRLIEKLRQGARIALVTDAGTPLISDPGFKLVREAAEAGVQVFPAPGPSAVTAALSAAGLPSDRFLFAGILPPRSPARREFFAELSGVPATLIFFETGPRLAECLADAASVLGRREAVVAREITKLFEEFRRGGLEELAALLAQGPAPRGEIVLLIGPPSAPEAAEAADVAAFLKALLADRPVKEAAAIAAARFGLPRREAYALALTLKADGD